jgi:hypothetical protein
VLASLSSANYSRADAAAWRVELAMEDAELLLSDDYSSLSPGYWVLYRGSYPDRATAAGACGAYADRVTRLLPRPALAGGLTRLVPEEPTHSESRVVVPSPVAHSGAGSSSMHSPS